MGPIIIFDKSFLESINPDESVWLDNFFLSNITPIFFIETLTDLEKKIKSGRNVEDVVGSLAYKTPDWSSRPNAYHLSLIQGELLGVGKIDMKNGRPHITGGKTLELEGKTGVIFQPSPEEEALKRWQNHKFLELERLQAKIWRQNLSNINLEENYKLFQIFFPIGKPKELAGIKKLVDLNMDIIDQERLLTFGLSLIGFSPEFQINIVTRWKKIGKPKLRDFAPYFVYVFSIDLFFYLSIAADLIGRGRPSHKIDLAYLYYLPFCMVFTSNDKLHSNIVPLFLREDQSFVSGADLKADLIKLDKHYDNLPDETKKLGVISFATFPPHDSSFLTTQLWDKHMSKTWRENSQTFKPQSNTKLGKKLMEEIQQFKKAKPTFNSISTSDKVDHIIIERKVLARKGKWVRFPPEVLNRHKNNQGEWEDD